MTGTPGPTDAPLHQTARLATALPARQGTGVSRLVIVLAVTGTILLALGAFWLSFTTLRDLAVLSGVPVEQAWIWPLIVDGVILEATISVVALRDSAASARRFAWLLLAAGAGVSVAANITHAVVAPATQVPAVVAAVVASVPPLVLLAMTHLTVELTRNSTPRMGSASPAGARGAVGPVPPAVLTQPGSLEHPARKPTRNRRPAPAIDSAVRARAGVLRAAGVSKREIATELGVHPTTVGRWLNAPERRPDGDPDD